MTEVGRGATEEEAVVGGLWCATGSYDDRGQVRIKGLKKTSLILEEEYPRSPQSINNRNELRNVLHLESLYKENKLAEKPLKTLLELMTKYFLESFGKNRKLKMTGDQNAVSSKIFSRGHQRSEPRISFLDINDISDSEAGESSAVSETSRIQIHRPESSMTRVPGGKCKTTDGGPRSSSSPTAPTDPEVRTTKELTMGISVTPESPAEARSATSEAQRPKTCRIVRGMMSGPIASSQEDSLKKRGQRRSSAVFQPIQPKDESQPNGHLGNTEELQGSSPNPALQLGKEFSAKLLSGSSSNTLLRSPPVHSVSRQEKQPHPAAEKESSIDLYNNFRMKFFLGAEQEKPQRSSKKSENSSASKRRTARSIAHEEANCKEDIRLDDIEDDLLTVDISQIPDLLPRSKVQVEGKSIDLQQAVELKKLLFGSPLFCFSEEWRTQSFTFSNTSSLKYGFVQKKGGPCGVLAAVQACVLKHLLFGKDSDISSALQPSDTRRSSCLYKAIAEILWRAGESKEAVVTLSSGRQQFSPAGRYKADGILESLILYSFTKYEDLVTFLQQNVNQFEYGPFGCILLTLSAILSRSIETVQKDFDVPTNCLIGAHAYCTQELVNLIMGGRAVSNVFNDVVELDSGNGNITILKGITSRGEIGFLSLFEHYSVCQVGSYLKTPKYPIWVVCSESHFSVLFCLKKELMSDWKAERRFDLYYYDGLANQQEEIRLTVDTSRAGTEDRENDLIPPLEYCIRTKWKGALVDWNGTEPIL
ncbi:probable ubiquitin carboxyl-terminal hydrolase MINDY-4 [Pseudophryne corroboree]|uniref:probable ubiquitin carboxyl-terminal hydrolase MINDY-4 n=1 Tax=Pseudophryne corroboree TaxID=495146 RepID=UPI003081C3FB